MHRIGWFSGAALSAALLVALALGSAAPAQEEAGPVTLELTPSRDSGVSGSAALRDVEGGVEVALDMRGLPQAGVEHINHFHGGGTCGEDRAGRTAPVTIPLDPPSWPGRGWDGLVHHDPPGRHAGPALRRHPGALLAPARRGPRGGGRSPGDRLRGPPAPGQRRRLARGAPLRRADPGDGSRSRLAFVSVA